MRTITQVLGNLNVGSQVNLYCCTTVSDPGIGGYLYRKGIVRVYKLYALTLGVRYGVSKELVRQTFR